MNDQNLMHKPLENYLSLAVSVYGIGRSLFFTHKVSVTHVQMGEWYIAHQVVTDTAGVMNMYLLGTTEGITS